jgi:undecaprenyl-diphosphatase
VIEVLKELDLSLFLFLNSLHTTILNPVMVFLSGQLIWIPLVGFFLFTAWKQLDRKSAWIFVLFLALTIIASDVSSSYIMKNIFTRLRPCRDPELIPLIYQFGQRCGGRFGFASSHAANAFALVSLTLTALRLKSSYRHLLWLAPLIVSYSRIYLGVHYPGDILVGGMIGIMWGLLLGVAFHYRQGASR